jgi:hypothetical protein
MFGPCLSMDMERCTRCEDCQGGFRRSSFRHSNATPLLLPVCHDVATFQHSRYRRLQVIWLAKHETGCCVLTPTSAQRDRPCCHPDPRRGAQRQCRRDLAHEDARVARAPGKASGEDPHRRMQRVSAAVLCAASARPTCSDTARTKAGSRARSGSRSGRTSTSTASS